jgi:hypothetical protein
MGFQPMYFQPETFAQANPVLTGYEAAQQMRANQYNNQIAAAKAQYAQPMAAQGLQQAILNNQVLGATAQYAMPNANLNNQILQNTANYAPQVSQANIANTNAQSGYYGANAGYMGAQANVINQTLPYKVQQAQGAVYTDPILSRLYQLTQANRTGTINPSLLRNVGMSAQPINQTSNQTSPQSTPDLNSYIAPSSSPLPTNQILPQNAYGAPLQTPVTPQTAPQAYNGNGMQNWALFGSPYNPIEMQQLESGAKTAGSTGVTQWNSTLNDAQTDSNLGYQLQNFATQFQNGYKNSTYTGPVEGRLPSSGYMSGLVPGNLTNEQITDNASQNAAALVAKLIAGGRVTNYEMQYMNTLKPNRSMTPAAAQMTSDFLIQRAKQMQQYPSFLNAAQKQGIDVHTAQVLWNSYRNQRPVYNFQTNSPNTQFDGTWRQYLNPQAVYSAQNGVPYISVPSGYLQKNNVQQFNNWFQTLNPQDRVLAKQQWQSANGGGK